MAKIYKYQKVTDARTTYCVIESDTQDDNRVTELCTVGLDTYISVPDVVVLPEQPKEITLEEIVMTVEVEKLIKDNSDHIKLINSRVVDRIREKYSDTDEIKMLRVGPSTETEAYNSWVEECRLWGSTEKEKLLGLSSNVKTESWFKSATDLTERITLSGKKIVL
jgi:hypothetical protein